MEDIWKTIAEDYEIAKQCLWCPKHPGGWIRQEDKGRYYLWKAYYAATQTEPKDYLLYARVLMMMNDEQHHAWEYDRFHKYIAPAKEAYAVAIHEGGKQPTAKEIEKVNFLFDSLQYVLKKTENTSEQVIDAYKLIEGLNDIQDFQFHDSKPIWFEHTSDRATLKLDFDGVVVTFSFEGLIDIEVNGDPTTNWINDFYCYPAFHNKDVLQFDIGYYRILCEKINVTDVERIAE
ncbi:MAG: hypothetical protein Q4B85_12180 [Lachnospiraceae bacterium]|nr:hypothetical protein [Lachnospiraceae bacterium]